MTEAETIYNQAVQIAREQHAELVKQFMAGTIEVLPGGMDMERRAIIAAFDVALEHYKKGWKA